MLCLLACACTYHGVCLHKAASNISVRYGKVKLVFEKNGLRPTLCVIHHPGRHVHRVSGTLGTGQSPCGLILTHHVLEKQAFQGNKRRVSTRKKRRSHELYDVGHVQRERIVDARSLQRCNEPARGARSCLRAHTCTHPA